MLWCPCFSSVMAVGEEVSARMGGTTTNRPSSPICPDGNWVLAAGSQWFSQLHSAKPFFKLTVNTLAHGSNVKHNGLRIFIRFSGNAHDVFKFFCCLTWVPALCTQMITSIITLSEPGYMLSKHGRFAYDLSNLLKSACTICVGIGKCLISCSVL